MLERFDRWFAAPLDAVRPWLLQRALLALVAVDCVSLLPRAWRYGVGEFSAAHFAVLDAWLPTAGAELYRGLLLVAGLAAAISVVRPTRIGIAVAALAWTASWSMSLLDTFQHHYLLSLLLALLAFFPRIELERAAHGAGSAWAFVLLVATLGVVYAWAALAKLDPAWQSGEMLWFLAHAPLADLFGIAEPARFVSAHSARLGLEPRSLLALASLGVVATELALAAAFIGFRALGDRARVAAVCIALGFHAAAEHVLMLQIGWFSYYMALFALCVLAPASWLQLIPRALSRLRARAVAARRSSMRLRSSPLVLLVLALAGRASAVDLALAIQEAPTAQSPGTQPDLDADVLPVEYFDGKQFPMQDFVSSSSSKDGRGYILVSADDPGDGSWNDHCERYGGASALPCAPRSLHLGLELPLRNSPQAGWIEVLIDSRRDESFLLANYPRGDDRRLLINYAGATTGGGFGGTPVIQQFKGNDNQAFPGWTLITGTPEAWSATVVILNPPGGVLEVEVGLALTNEIVNTSAKFGLGIQHVPPPGAAVPPPFQQLPNVATRFDIRFPIQWKTVVLQDYDPIPMEFVTYNVGQMPTVWLCVAGPIPPDDVSLAPLPCLVVPLGDGGEGEPNHFADVLWDKEVSCLQEMWARSDREELIDEVNSRRDQNNLPPVDSVGAPPDDNPDGDGKSYVTAIGIPHRVCLWTPYVLAWHCDDMYVDQYTGLLMLSDRSMLERGVFEFGEESSGQCYGDFTFILNDNFNNDFDCAQDKGMLWGRVMTAAAEPSPSPTGAPGEAWDLSQVIDVFCTHIDSGSDATDLSAREAGMEQLKTWIDSVRLPDRPAVFGGDMNTDWHTEFAVQQASLPGSADYQTMKDLLGIGQPSFFDSLNTTFSDVYDVAAVDANNDRIGTDPTITFNTVLGECSPQTEANMNSAPVIDYVFLLPPPTDETTFPNFTIKKDPTASVDPQYRDNLIPQPNKCLSDHAMLHAKFELIQTYEPGKWNAARTHTIRHSIPSLWDFEEGAESDSDWFSDNHWIHVGASAGSWSTSCNNDHPAEDTCDGSNCGVDWSTCSLDASGTNFAGARLVVDDEEGAGVYNYDTSPHGPAGAGQRNMHFVLDHFLGSWVIASDSWSATGTPQFYDQTNPPPDAKVFEFGFVKEGDGEIGTEETDYRARATHRLRAEEQ